MLIDNTKLVEISRLSSVAVVIPTYNAIRELDVFETNLSVLRDSGISHILIIDSSSSDDTVAVAAQYGAMVHVIAKKDFNHGATRTMGLELLSDKDITYVLYMTQDAVFASVEDVYHLYDFVITNNLAGCYARQVARDNATIMARHLREFNYGKQSYVIKYQDKAQYGMKSIFNSNSCAIYDYKLLQAIGGFSSNVILSEDSLAFAEFLRLGYAVGYDANSICIHSHNYSLIQDFRRYFDIGVFQELNRGIIEEFGYIRSEGKRYIASEIRYVMGHNLLMLPSSVVHICAKISGFILGRNYKKLSIAICRRLSMHKKWWDQYYV